MFNYNLSAHGAADLLISEAIVTSRYRDSVGVWTIGVGHTKAAGGVDPAQVSRILSVDECLQIFKEDVPKYALAVNKAITVPVTQYEFDAMLSFHFNTGGIGRAVFVKDLNAGKPRDVVARGFMNWVTPSSIIGRRTREMNLFRTGKYAADTRASVYPADGGRVQWSKGQRIGVLQTLEKMFPHIFPSVPPDSRPILRTGSRGPAVAEWQGILLGLGFDLGKWKDDGVFGANPETSFTYKATIKFQKAASLVPDGVVGEKTWTAGLKKKGNL